MWSLQLQLLQLKESSQFCSKIRFSVTTVETIFSVLHSKGGSQVLQSGREFSLGSASNVTMERILLLGVLNIVVCYLVGVVSFMMELSFRRASRNLITVCEKRK